MSRGSVDDLLARFPKRRPPLPPAYESIYADYYQSNRSGKGAASLSRITESWLHRKVARDVGASDRAHAGSTETLEIGAGNLNHLAFEPDTGPYDAVEPMTALYEGSIDVARVRRFYADTRDIPLSQQYDRIISVATFEHVCDLPAVVARVGLLVRPGGSVRIGIPSEGSVLWEVGWRLTTGLEFRLRRGLSYGVIMRHEHVNKAPEIVAVLRCFFGNVSRSCFGIGRQLSLYQYLECRDSDRQRCEQYLKHIACGANG